MDDKERKGFSDGMDVTDDGWLPGVAPSLADFATCDLVEELRRRPGVFELSLDNEGHGAVGITGPVTCLVVLD